MCHFTRFRVILLYSDIVVIALILSSLSYFVLFLSSYEWHWQELEVHGSFFFSNFKFQVNVLAEILP